MQKLILIFLLCCISLVPAISQSIKVGDRVAVPAVDGKTYNGTVMQIIHTAHKIKYDGFDDNASVWLTRDQFSLLGTKSVNNPAGNNNSASNNKSGLQIGTKVQAFVDSKWHPGIIVDAKDGKFKFRYDGWSDNWDTWLPANQLRIPGTQAVANSKWKKGTKVEAYTDNKWWPGAIVDEMEGKYMIQFDGWSDDYNKWVAVSELRLPGDNGSVKMNLGNNAAGKLYLRHIRWLATGGSSLNWYFFADNGTLVVDPKHGVNPVDLNAERVDNMKNMGTYVLTQNRLKVKWINGSTSEVEVEYKNGELIRIDAASIALRQYGLPANFKLNGTYSGVTGVGGIAQSRTFTFSSNGSFRLTKTGYAQNEALGAIAEKKYQGTYNIKGNTLQLNYADGHVEKASIAVWDNRIVINNTSLPLAGN